MSASPLPRRVLRARRTPGSDAAASGARLPVDRAEPLPRPDWRDSLALAADLALTGILLTFACVLVVPAGAALVTASVAMDQVGTDRTFPAARELLRVLRRSLARGAVTALLALVGIGLLALDALALASGWVPGGTPLLLLTAVVAGAGLAVAGTALVLLGQAGGRGYRAALRAAVRLLRARPPLGVAVLATLAIPALLAGVVPGTAPLLPGFVLFGLHVVVRRAIAR